MRIRRFVGVWVGVSLGLLILPGANGRAAAQGEFVPNNTPIVSVMLSPAETTLTVGQTQTLQFTALLQTGHTRILDGGFMPIWNITFEPAIVVTPCATDSVSYSSQNFQIDAETGAFNQVWSPTMPDTLRAVGAMSIPTGVADASVSAALECLNGAATGSFEAEWNTSQYDGTFTFNGGGGAIAVYGTSWTSSNPSVASVRPGGGIEALSPGDAVITATFGSKCWQSMPSAALCRGTVSATATVHVEEDDGGGGGEGCAAINLVLAPDSVVFPDVLVTVTDPLTDEELVAFTVALNEAIEAPEGTFRLNFTARPGYTVAPPYVDVTTTCGSTVTVTLLFALDVPPPTLDTLVGQAIAAGVEQGVNLLGNAKSRLLAGDLTPACNQIGAYMKQVRAQAGKKLPLDTAATMLDAAAEVKGLLGCQ